ncbi:uncharacterized protein PHACADRAFT_142204 [Phanerochaete carnosa HHB-10118-sp]|uniref:Uncharacterized protein n=1 Tax=Phanerochaete carnosa (strain HHB-10118-sp) TaxID=650164 RepID=K5VZQ8_PHACS|nr:uncharacterized protein PHACADRAFT_142204 [Phanerochaete carnosa HHB-10118-sp]EKM57073.1 hypothetical protein PHACADRAFT_142204 [Phanerochaete carnosa HHB-10118-sp]
MGHLCRTPIVGLTRCTAIGNSWYQGLDIPGRSFLLYSGFMMTNNCKLIAESGSTKSSTQYCSGGYNDGRSVTYDSNHK